eukprot:4583951-Prymnesium_polylepis.1
MARWAARHRRRRLLASTSGAKGRGTRCLTTSPGSTAPRRASRAAARRAVCARRPCRCACGSPWREISGRRRVSRPSAARATCAS